jgi:hypothetical protein
VLGVLAVIIAVEVLGIEKVMVLSESLREDRVWMKGDLATFRSNAWYFSLFESVGRWGISDGKRPVQL